MTKTNEPVLERISEGSLWRNNGVRLGNNTNMVTSATHEKSREPYKLLKKNYRVDDLRIHLDITISGESVSLRIEFRNVSDVTMNLVFGNANGEVEQGQLILTDAQGERVTPTHRQRIDNREDDLTIIEIGPHSQWTYPVEGTLVEGILSLRGVVYDLTPGTSYQLQYRYPFDRTQEHVSNIADMNVPLIATVPAERVLAVAHPRA